MGFRVISRREWGARHGDGRWPRSLPAREAWLHHSVTVAPDLDPPRGDDYAAIRTIERIGANRFGSVYGFPYTFGITPAGLIFEGHHIGNTGAHTKGHNTIGIGIVLVGNYERRRMTDEQIDACAWLLRKCEHEGWLRDATLHGGHRDVYATACPGRHAYARIDTINRRARSGDFEEEDELSWSEELAHWAPKPYDQKGKTHAGQQLNQARGYAEGAYRDLHRGAHLHAAAIERKDIGSDERVSESWVLQELLRRTAQISGLQATVNKLVDMLTAFSGGTDFDPEVLKRELREAIESVSVRLDVGEES